MTSFVSASDAFYYTLSGDVPRGSIRTVDGERWVCSYETWQRVPPGAASYAHEDSSDAETNRFGTRTRREWGRDPDWFSRHTYWRGFIPVPSPVSPMRQSWVFDFEHEVPFDQVPLHPSDPYDTSIGFQLPFADQDSAIDIMQAVHASTADFARAYGTSPFAGQPLEYDTRQLRAIYPTLESLARVVGTARRTILDHLGYAAWNVCLYVDWQDRVSQSTRAVVEEWQLRDTPRRGFLCDLPRDWREINLPFWIAHSVPTFWRWRLIERSEPRFARVSPECLEVLDLDEQADTTPAIGAVHSPAAPVYTSPPALDDPYRYDKFLQYRYFDTARSRPAPNSTKGALQHRVIDFEEWKSRPISRAEQKVLFRRVFFQDNNIRGAATRLYHRARPIMESRTTGGEVDSADEDEAYDSEREEMEDSLVILRETLRRVYAPERDEVVDHATGQLWQGVPVRDTPAGPPRHRSEPSMGELESLVARVNGTHPSLRPRTYDDFSMPGSPLPSNSSRSTRPPSSTSSSVSHRRERASQRDPYPAARPLLERIQLAQSLEQRITSPRSHPTPTPPPSSYQSSRQTSPALPQGGSASPIRLRGPNADDGGAETWPYESFLGHMRTIMTPRTLLAVRLPFPRHLAWNENYIKYGVLFIPARSSEVRLRYWSLQDHSLDKKTILLMALERHIEFSIEVPRNRIPLFAPPRTEPISDAVSIYYEPDYRDERMSPEGTGRDIVLRYRNLVNGVLSRHHARKLLYKGSLIARIAWQFGGPELVARALQGPSIQVTRFNRGYTRLATDTCDEMIAKYEEDILLGRFATPATGEKRAERSLWPAPHQFEKINQWDGEWNPMCEAFFESIFQEIRDENPRPRTPGEWEQYIRTNNRRNPPTPGIELNNAEWGALSDSFVERYLRPWDGTPLRALAVPEDAER